MDQFAAVALALAILAVPLVPLHLGRLAVVPAARAQRVSLGLVRLVAAAVGVR